MPPPPVAHDLVHKTQAAAYAAFDHADCLLFTGEVSTPALRRTTKRST